jgi:hypothetical protein
MPFALTILAVLGVSATSDAGLADVPGCRTTLTAHRTYVAESERGDRMMAIGQYDLAADAYRTAQRSSCGGGAEILLYGPLAEAECRAGRVEVGQSVLADYACILAVILGERQCGASGNGRDEVLTLRCKAVMCREASFQESVQESQLEGWLQAAQEARLACQVAQ